ncbi:MAG: TolC family protein [Deltaproteobacteria bacterium]|nr:TolC family protein [Deltaproteobacteria bacterium]
MRALPLLLVAVAACMPSRSGVFRPVDREVERRLGVTATWGEPDAATTSAITALLAKPLDRAAVVRIAIATNRRLQARYDELGIAASAIATATVLGPTQVDVSYKYALADGHSNETEIDVTQDILELLQISQRRGVASAELAAARARAVAATVELVARVEGAFVDVVAAQQELELRQTAFDAASASADLTDRMHAAGNVSDLVVARERDRRESSRLDLGRAQVDVELRRELLNELMGVTGDRTKWSIVERLGDLPATAPPLDDLERTAVGASLELEAAKHDGEAAAARVGVARLRAWLPELGVGVSASREGGEWAVGPAVSFGLPIFDQQQGSRARAHAELRRARNEATATAVELRARARASRQRVLAAYAEARHLLTVVLPLRQRILDETLKQYNAMNASPFELLVARREVVDGGRQYIDALRRYWRADADARALARGGMVAGDDDRAPASSSGGGGPAGAQEH